MTSSLDKKIFQKGLSLIKKGISTIQLRKSIENESLNRESTERIIYQLLEFKSKK